MEGKQTGQEEQSLEERPPEQEPYPVYPAEQPQEEQYGEAPPPPEPAAVPVPPVAKKEKPAAPRKLKVKPEGKAGDEAGRGQMSPNRGPRGRKEGKSETESLSPGQLKEKDW